MSALFRRVVNVAVAPRPDNATNIAGDVAGGFDLTGLDCAFKAKKNLKKEPNHAEIVIYNLAPETRAALQTSKRNIVQLDAGYPDSVCSVYRGEVRAAVVRREGPDIVTTIESGDGEREMQAGFVSFAGGKKAPASHVLAVLAEAMQVGPGNSPEIGAMLDARGVMASPVIFGPAASELSDFCRSFGFEWSIQQGVLQLLALGQGLNATVVELSSESGLIGSPTIDAKGVVRARSLIQPDLEPGRRVRINGANFGGDFRIEEVEISGDTSGEDWYIDIVARAPKDWNKDDSASKR